MAKKINHRGRGGHRELLFSLCPLCVFRSPLPEDTKKSLNPPESTQDRSPPFPMYVPSFIIQTSALLLFAADMHQN